MTAKAQRLSNQYNNFLFALDALAPLQHHMTCLTPTYTGVWVQECEPGAHILMESCQR